MCLCMCVSVVHGVCGVGRIVRMRAFVPTCMHVCVRACVSEYMYVCVRAFTAQLVDLTKLSLHTAPLLTLLTATKCR